MGIAGNLRKKLNESRLGKLVNESSLGKKFEKSHLARACEAVFCGKMIVNTAEYSTPDIILAGVQILFLPLSLPLQYYSAKHCPTPEKQKEEEEERKKEYERFMETPGYGQRLSPREMLGLVRKVKTWKEGDETLAGEAEGFLVKFWYFRDLRVYCEGKEVGRYGQNPYEGETGVEKAYLEASGAYREQIRSRINEKVKRFREKKDESGR